MSDVDDDTDSGVHDTLPVNDIPFDDLHRHEDPATLNDGEVYWRDRQEWLAECGYLLRHRYRRNWRPSWERSNRDPRSFEDGLPMPVTQAYFTMDALHVADRNITLLKRVQMSKSDIPPEEHPEVAIMRYFSSEDLSRDPKNHCVPLHDVLSEPDTGDLILVTPFLRPFNNPRFLTVGEVIDFIGQILEGLDFMHQHNIAHRNCTAENIMMDGTKLYPGGFHPVLLNRLETNVSRKAKHLSRTEHRPTYYLCNFALSEQFDPSRGPPSAMPVHASDRSVPEFQGDGIEQPHDPFPTDVYLIGNMIKFQFAVSKYGFDFLYPLVENMTQDDPALRPTMNRVVSEFNELRSTLRKGKLRSRVISNNESEAPRLFDGISHFFRTMKFTIKGIPPASSNDRKAPQYSDTAPWPDDTASSYDEEQDGPHRIPEHYQQAVKAGSRRTSVKEKEGALGQGTNGHYIEEIESASSLAHQNAVNAERQSLSRQGHNVRPSRSNSVADQTRPRANSRSTQPAMDTRPVRRDSSTRRREMLPDEHRSGHINGSTRASLNHPRPPSAQVASVKAPSRRDPTPPRVQPASVKASSRREHTPPPAQFLPSTRAPSHRNTTPPPAPPPKPERPPLGKWDCAICRAKISGKSESIEHMLQKHAAYKICQDCGSYYTSAVNLEKHQDKRGHGEHNRGRKARKRTGDD